MAYYATINEQNIVIQVMTGVDEMVTQTDANGTEVGGSTEAWEQFYTAQLANPNLYVKQTSYNDNFCGCYAGVGYTYNADADVFITPQPYGSWTLDENFDWQPPTPKPDGNYQWFEPNQQWIEVIEP